MTKHLVPKPFTEENHWIKAHSAGLTFIYFCSSNHSLIFSFQIVRDGENRRSSLTENETGSVFFLFFFFSLYRWQRVVGCGPVRHILGSQVVAAGTSHTTRIKHLTDGFYSSWSGSEVSQQTDPLGTELKPTQICLCHLKLDNNR